MSAEEFVIPPAPRPALIVEGSSKRFPVRRLYCIGRNYAAHAIEMGHDPDREPPFFFQKNPDNIRTDGIFPMPAISEDVQYEVEMVVALKSGGHNIPIEQANDCIFGYGLGLDMTRRDLQAEMKKMGRPWEIGKAFEHSAPMGPVVPFDQIGHLSSGEISLSINGVTVQTGDLAQMIWKTPEIISVLSRYFTLCAGDVIMTGTPAGVGPIQAGDQMRASLAGVEDLTIQVTDGI
ncbi:fumarylacetoacetase [Amylibacter marinus]|uniref:Fumarylacetoacetase n=1 Tax=Amylibacter marinus TaxID=1475483 RepID=A0ABQ5VSM0_9RHOB|nr:fumarylacetoacetate hydrolase family protein [Amylibacter marinus]GLQ34286.1 fumarylacetoacetase [Amylibacter marinus]